MNLNNKFHRKSTFEFFASILIYGLIRLFFFWWYSSKIPYLGWGEGRSWGHQSWVASLLYQFRIEDCQLSVVAWIYFHLFHYLHMLLILFPLLCWCWIRIFSEQKNLLIKIRLFSRLIFNTDVDDCAYNSCFFFLMGCTIAAIKRNSELNCVATIGFQSVIWNVYMLTQEKFSNKITVYLSHNSWNGVMYYYFLFLLNVIYVFAIYFF